MPMIDFLVGPFIDLDALNRRVWEGHMYLKYTRLWQKARFNSLNI